MLIYQSVVAGDDQELRLVCVGLQDGPEHTSVIGSPRARVIQRGPSDQHFGASFLKGVVKGRRGLAISPTLG